VLSLVVADVNGDKLGSNAVAFLYHARFGISMLSPSSGPIAGGTKVTVIGDGMPNEMSCKFGHESEGTPCSWLSSSLSHCSSPKHRKVGEVRFMCYSKDLGSAVAEKLFAFVMTAFVQSVMPSVGYERGGDIVTLVGLNFIPAQRIVCHFGADAVDGAFFSSSISHCKSVAHTPGSVALTITRDGSLVDGSNNNMFLFLRDFEIWKFSPSSGIIASNSAVSMFGAFFDARTRFFCYFGSDITVADFTSSTHLLCSMPDISPAAQVDFGLSISGQAAHYLGKFEFVQESRLLALMPSTGLAGEGISPFVVGYGFINSSSLSCRIGDGALKKLSMCLRHWFFARHRTSRAVS